MHSRGEAEHWRRQPRGLRREPERYAPEREDCPSGKRLFKPADKVFPSREDASDPGERSRAAGFHGSCSGDKDFPPGEWMSRPGRRCSPPGG